MKTISVQFNYILFSYIVCVSGYIYTYLIHQLQSHDLAMCHCNLGRH